MSLEIPNGALKVLGQLVAYDRKKLEVLMRVIKSSPPSLIPANLAKQFASQASVSENEANSIVYTIMSLYGTRMSKQVAADRFQSEFFDAVEPIKANATDEQWRNLREFMAELFSLRGPIEVTSKAWGILIGNERNFVEGKIFTDLRPIYKENPAESPAGAVIVHTLRLTFVKDDKRRSTFIALDSSDLKKLKQVIDRAEIKESSLLASISDSKLTVLQPEE